MNFVIKLLLLSSVSVVFWALVVCFDERYTNWILPVNPENRSYVNLVVIKLIVGAIYAAVLFIPSVVFLKMINLYVFRTSFIFNILFIFIFFVTFYFMNVYNDYPKSYGNLVYYFVGRDFFLCFIFIFNYYRYFVVE